MPASAAKWLWQASTREQWETLYNRWLARWDDSGYLQGELAGIDPGVTMDRRSEMWLEETDECGITMMSIDRETAQARDLIKNQSGRNTDRDQVLCFPGSERRNFF
ncbi:hypothetical protein V1506DRAFT_407003 [Lipomyces tetrasporus]